MSAASFEKVRRGLVVAAVALLLPLVACKGSDDEDDPGSGVDRNKKLASLSATERAAMCTWAAGLFGGYGMTKACTAQRGWSGPRSAEECVADLGKAGSACAATVATYEECQRAFFTEEACRENASFPPPCQTVIACM